MFWFCVLVQFIFLFYVRVLGGTLHNDVSIHSYNDDGNIFQFQYAVKSVHRGPPLICISQRSNNRYIFIGARAVKSSSVFKQTWTPMLQIRMHTSAEKRTQSKSGLMIATTGMESDRKLASKLINKVLFDHTQSHGIFLSSLVVSEKLAKWVTTGLYSNFETDPFKRPLSIVSVMMEFPLHHNGRPPFLVVDSSGSIRYCNKVITGDIRLGIDEDMIEHSTTAELVDTITRSLSEFEHFECAIFDVKTGGAEMFTCTTRDILVANVRASCDQLFTKDI